LFKLAIELVDKYSFGFQKGKCAHMAVGEIAAILDTKIERVHKVYNNKKKQDSKFYFFTK
jgi:hypothetical protein